MAALFFLLSLVKFHMEQLMFFVASLFIETLLVYTIILHRIARSSSTYHNLRDLI